MSASSGKIVWVGRVISVLAGGVFVMSGVMKLMGGPEAAEGMAHLGLGEAMITPLAIVELSCAAIYLIPRTSVVGAILLTGYMGGAILAHRRVGDPFVIQVLIPVLVWLGLGLRENRLRALLPLRASTE